MTVTMPSEQIEFCRILLLEDSALDAELVQEQLILSGLAIQVELVQTEHAFTEALTRPGSGHDIILADRSLPGFDGITALAIARRIAPDLPFVFVSGTIGEEQAIDAVKAGATDYVLKQRLARLASVVRRALAERAERMVRQTAEAALRVTQARLARLLRTVPVGVLEIDLNGRVIYANDPANRILGALPGGVLGKDYADPAWRYAHTDGSDFPSQSLPALRALRGETVSDVQHALTTLDGRSIAIVASVVPERDETGTVTGALLALQDVTVRLEQSKALREVAEQLQHVQKMDAMGKLTGGIAHDFNNMLQAIGGGLELCQLRLSQGQTDAAARSAAEAHRSVERAAGLTQRLLAFARRQKLQPVPVRVDDLIGDMVELIRRTVGPSIAVQIALDAADRFVLCDPSQLENVLLNLSINARDAMAAGGALRFATRTIQIGERERSSAMVVAPGPYVEISILDTGTGMDEATRSRAFEPFFTTKAEGHGTGLGLSQTYGFVHQSGGGLQLESTPGQGTTIRLFLPQHEAEIAVAQPAAKSANVAASERATLILLEDEDGVRTVLAEWLRERGYDVVEARDGYAALDQLKSGLRADLLITDVGLPNGLDGRQTADAARALLPQLPVLFVTGYAASMPEHQLAPGMEVIGKPFALETLMSQVQTMLQRRREPD